MKIAKVRIIGVSNYSQSKSVRVPKKGAESDADYEARTWKERCHFRTRDGQDVVIFPPMSLKKSIEEAAKFRGEKIKGKGQKTWTKRFLSGILIADENPLLVNGEPITREEVEGEWLFVPSDGKRGGARRVDRKFPFFEGGTWEVTVDIEILDGLITRDVLERHLQTAGDFIGLGRFRPERGGYYGRFKFEILSWEEFEDEYEVAA